MAVLAVLAVLIAAEAHGAKVVDRIVAVVNDDIIALSELNHLLEPFSEKIKAFNYSPEKEQEMLFKVREDILEQLINRKLTVQETKRAKITVTDQEVDLALEQVKMNSRMTDEMLREALKQQGVSYDEYRENVKEQLLRTKLVNLMVRSKIVITEDEIKSYYQKHYDKYKGEKQYHLRNILMRIPRFASDADKEKIRKRMEEIAERLADDESFTDLARTYSEVPGAAAEGGDLGLFKIESLSPQLRGAIKSLQPGDYTPVLETDQGYQIFYIQNIVTTPDKPLEQVAPEIQQTLFNEVINDKYRAWLEKLREKSHIRIIR